MNGFATLSSSTACWHDGAQVSEGPTTHQRNWWCPACGAQRTTFPGDSAEAHFAARTARSQAPAVGADDARDAARYRWLRNHGQAQVLLQADAGVDEQGFPVQASAIAQIPSVLDAAIDAAMAASKGNVPGTSKEQP